MSFIIVITLPILDLAYTVANLQVCSSFAGDSQALAGSIFSVATRVSRNFSFIRNELVYPYEYAFLFI